MTLWLESLTSWIHIALLQNLAEILLFAAILGAIGTAPLLLWLASSSMFAAKRRDG